ncbi:MAG: cytochrome c [Alphaproteobacteria bacterium]|nr:cytochrome c [Alphaproteobacteria bacterium]
MLAFQWRPIAAALALTLLTRAITAAANEGAAAHGEYLVRAGGCFSCHTAPGGEALAGGRALATPFGTFYSPNITPDPATGIGRWTGAQFLRALREGIRPDGANYFPVFPYTSFTRITEDDALAMKAYLFSLPAVHQQNRPHDVALPFSWRFLQTGWKLLFFTPGPFQPIPDRSDAYNRGAYLVNAFGHCGECHTPRNLLGATRSGWRLAGTPDGPDGQLVPNITPDPATGIGKWDKDDVVELLRTGMTPERSKVKGAMREVVEDGLKYLNDGDLKAIADYLLAQPPIVHDPAKH